MLISAQDIAQTRELTVTGVLDSATYATLRDAIIKAALDQPTAVIVDMSDLDVPAQSALAVFTSARWHVNRWPDVPVLLVCSHALGRDALRRNGVTRYVPVFADRGGAHVELAKAHGTVHGRLRARTELAASASTLDQARDFVADYLRAWTEREMVPSANVVVTALVENVLQHTQGGPVIRLECDNGVVTIAVEDSSRSPAVTVEKSDGQSHVSGLAILTSMCRMWGNAPTPAGKTVWAVLGPENRL